MKKLLICLFIISSLTSNAQNADSTWIRDHYQKKEVYITMRDGVKLFTSVYMPKDTATKHPVLITRTPYSCQPYGVDKWKPYWETYLKEYFKEGYIMVMQDGCLPLPYWRKTRDRKFQTHRHCHCYREYFLPASQ